MAALRCPLKPLRCPLTTERNQGYPRQRGFSSRVCPPFIQSRSSSVVTFALLLPIALSLFPLKRYALTTRSYDNFLLQYCTEDCLACAVLHLRLRDRIRTTRKLLPGDLPIQTFALESAFCCTRLIRCKLDSFDSTRPEDRKPLCHSHSSLLIPTIAPTSSSRFKGHSSIVVIGSNLF